MPGTTLKRCAVCQNWSHCTATGYCNCGAYSVRQDTTGHYHRIHVFDNETEVLVTEIVLTHEQVEALRPYLMVGDDEDIIGEHEIGQTLSLFVGATANA